MRQLGTYDIPPILTDPRDWLIADELRRCGYIVHSGPDSALAQLPIFPGFRAQFARASDVPEQAWSHAARGY